MAITYANIPLCDPTAEVMPEIQTWAEFVESNLSFSRFFPQWARVIWPSLRTSFLTWPGYVPDEPVRLNTLVWPTGASRWAHFHTIINEEQRKSIMQQVGGAGGTGYNAKTLEISWYDHQDQQVDKVSTSMYALAMAPLNQLVLGGSTPSGAQPYISEGLYLLTLVDERYFWWFNSTGSVDITEGTTTWATLFTNACSDLGISITTDSIASAYLKPSAFLTTHYEFAPCYLDALAYNTGLRIVRKLDGTIVARNATNSQTDLTNNLNLPTARSRRAGGKYFYTATTKPNDLPAMVPNTVQVIYPKTDCDLLPGTDYKDSTTLSALSLSDFSGVTGNTGKKTFHDSCTADFTGGSIVNGSEITALTQQIATDFYRFSTLVLDIKWDEIINVAPSGQCDRVEWVHRSNEVTTRILPNEVNDLAMDLFHSSAANSITKSGYIGYYGNWAFPGPIHMDNKRSWKPTDANISTNQNNYPVPTTPYLRLNCTSASNITGFANGNEGLAFLLRNKGTATITLKHEDTNSLAANRIVTSTSSDVSVIAKDAVWLEYDCVANRWYAAQLTTMANLTVTNLTVSTSLTFSSGSTTTYNSTSTLIIPGTASTSERSIWVNNCTLSYYCGSQTHNTAKEADSMAYAQAHG